MSNGHRNNAQGAELAPSQVEAIDDIVSRFMAEFEIPGAALALVQPKGSVLTKGYGVRRLGDPAPVDIFTQFAIASTSKAFLAACLALLVDEGKLGWDDLVIAHLPAFRMYDPAVTAMMTVRDLLVHHSGLPLGAGDLMVFPESHHSSDDILRGLRFLKPSCGFRTRYTYDNILYIVAGIVLERVSGLGWDQFVQERIFNPLGMREAVSNPTLARGANRAGRHGRLGPPSRGMGHLEIVDAHASAITGPAGGIVVSIAEIVPWLRVQLGRGSALDGTRLWSTYQADEMWTPRTIVASGPGPSSEAPERSVMQGYALGWGVNDYRGRRMISHGGLVAGQASRAALLPEQNIGLFLCVNTEDSTAVSGLRYAILDYLLDAPCYDWIAATRGAITKAQEEVLEVASKTDFHAPPGGPTKPLDQYTGLYRDPWYGDIRVGQNAGALAIDFIPTPLFKSALEPFGVDTFRTRFPRGCEDAVVSFVAEDQAFTRLKMRALSPLADFSFDFHDLNCVRIE